MLSLTVTKTIIIITTYPIPCLESHSRSLSHRVSLQCLSSMMAYWSIIKLSSLKMEGLLWTLCSLVLSSITDTPTHSYQWPMVTSAYYNTGIITLIPDFQQTAFNIVCIKKKFLFLFLYPGHCHILNCALFLPCSWFVGPTITLQHCLSAFFSADELKGDNMYSCEQCKKWVYKILKKVQMTIASRDYLSLSFQ